ncbi:MAG: thymidine kinase, partial [Alicyclobacillus sp.]|nr:thymidine kinase [Alicyclobacillus sp.]
LTADKDVRERRVLTRDGELPDGRTFDDETEQAWRGVRGAVIDTTPLSAQETCEAVWDVVRGGDV